jgi:PBP1b-binding outer membrane lipoprotein LpoB
MRKLTFLLIMVAISCTEKPKEDVNKETRKEISELTKKRDSLEKLEKQLLDSMESAQLRKF